jgi:hypothetical protein
MWGHALASFEAAAQQAARAADPDLGRPELPTKREH